MRVALKEGKTMVELLNLGETLHRFGSAVIHRTQLTGATTRSV
ncbi:hypothetical protein ACU4HD_33760 [Cupriavidus basilensis]